MPESVLDVLNVSREAREQLGIYVDLLTKWNSKINLISKASRDAIWHRHIEDSAQLCRISVVKDPTWLDVGSGGGLPGLVIAIILKDQELLGRMTLVESDLRKATFLREVVRLLDLPVKVISERIETLQPHNADVISARALAPLSQLFELSYMHLRSSTVMLFPKGETYLAEITQAREKWNFDVKLHKSETHRASAILEVMNVEKKSSGA